MKIRSNIVPIFSFLYYLGRILAGFSKIAYLYLGKPMNRRGDSFNMKKWVVLLVLLCVSGLFLPCEAQQIMYANLRELVECEGDTVTTLRVERRSKNQILLMGGGDYRIEVDENPGLNRYLRKRCYAVRIDTALYVNCRKMRYKRYRFGNCYAAAMQVGGKFYFCTQPVGQAATSTAQAPDATKLGGEVGDAIAASALVAARVFYEVQPETGRAEFVSRDKMMALLEGYPDLQANLRLEQSEAADVMVHYLRALQRMDK